MEKTGRSTPGSVQWARERGVLQITDLLQQGWPLETTLETAQETEAGIDQGESAEVSQLLGGKA